ncbi:MAG: DUF1573 domain-containing protein [Bacteroidales bacterium]|jgi:hypothetical protein|nr:DUF1573 domain-containing protein [Bacteroidales bacterium]
MKKLFFLTLLVILSSAVFAQVEEKTAKKTKGKKVEIAAEDTLPKLPAIHFTSLVHDYGNIYKNGDGVCYFQFSNTGRADLQLTNVTSSCGCTIPEWPKDPIPPGKSATIKVSYNTSRIGAINKNIFVDSNVGEKITLTIKGNVLEPASEIVPENKTSPMMKNN